MGCSGLVRLYSRVFKLGLEGAVDLGCTSGRGGIDFVETLSKWGAVTVMYRVLRVGLVGICMITFACLLSSWKALMPIALKVFRGMSKGREWRRAWGDFSHRLGVSFPKSVQCSMLPASSEMASR